MVVALILLGIGGFVFPPALAGFSGRPAGVSFQGQANRYRRQPRRRRSHPAEANSLSRVAIGSPEAGDTALGRLRRYLRGDVICRVQVPDLSESFPSSLFQ
jgi:hypothetical protein